MFPLFKKNPKTKTNWTNEKQPMCGREKYSYTNYEVYMYGEKQ